MKRIISLLAVLVVLAFGSIAGAQTIPNPEASGVGRPDPTGRGRYLQFGHEQEYKGAKVLKELPEGAKCAPAGELVSVPLWNSTREGHAIVSKLTDKAEVATSDQGVFLCWCANGFNQLFVPEPAAKKESATTAVATPTPTPVAPLAEAAKNRVERDGNNPVNVSVKVPVTINNGGGHTTALVIGGSILLAVVAAIAYDHSKDDSKPATRTPNPKVYTNPTGWLGLSITLPLGGS